MPKCQNIPEFAWRDWGKLRNSFRISPGRFKERPSRARGRNTDYFI